MKIDSMNKSVGLPLHRISLRISANQLFEIFHRSIYILWQQQQKNLEKNVIDAWWDLFHFSSNHKLPIVSHEFSLSTTGAFQIFYYINMHWYYVKPLPPIVTNEEKKIGKFFYVHVQVQLLLLYYLLDRLHPGRKKQ